MIPGEIVPTTMQLLARTNGFRALPKMFERTLQHRKVAEVMNDHRARSATGTPAAFDHAEHFENLPAEVLGAGIQRLDFEKPEGSLLLKSRPGRRVLIILHGYYLPGNSFLDHVVSLITDGNSKDVAASLMTLVLEWLESSVVTDIWGQGLEAPLQKLQKWCNANGVEDAADNVVLGTLDAMAGLSRISAGLEESGVVDEVGSPSVAKRRRGGSHLNTRSSSFFLNFDTLNTKECAGQLSLVTLSLRELVTCAALVEAVVTEQQDDLSQKVKDAMEWAADVPFWVSTTILHAPSRKRRTIAVSRFLKMIKYLLELGDYCTAYCVLQGLRHPAVARLGSTLKDLPSKSVVLLGDFMRLFHSGLPSGTSACRAHDTRSKAPPQVRNVISQQASGTSPLSTPVGFGVRLDGFAEYRHSVSFRNTTAGQQATCIPSLNILLEDLQSVVRPSAIREELSVDQHRYLSAMLDEYHKRWFGHLSRARLSREQYQPLRDSRGTIPLDRIRVCRRTFRENDLLSISMTIEPAGDSEEWTLEAQFPNALKRKPQKIDLGPGGGSTKSGQKAREPPPLTKSEIEALQDSIQRVQNRCDVTMRAWESDMKGRLNESLGQFEQAYRAQVKLVSLRGVLVDRIKELRKLVKELGKLADNMCTTLYMSHRIPEDIVLVILSDGDSVRSRLQSQLSSDLDRLLSEPEDSLLDATKRQQEIERTARTIARLDADITTCRFQVYAYRGALEENPVQYAVMQKFVRQFYFLSVEERTDDKDAEDDGKEEEKSKLRGGTSLVARLTRAKSGSFQKGVVVDPVGKGKVVVRNDFLVPETLQAVVDNVPFLEVWTEFMEDQDDPVGLVYVSLARDSDAWTSTLKGLYESHLVSDGNVVRALPPELVEEWKRMHIRSYPNVKETQALFIRLRDTLEAKVLAPRGSLDEFFNTPPGKVIAEDLGR